MAHSTASKAVAFKRLLDFSLRPATREDIPRLMEIEETCFQIDRMTARAFRHAVSGANASLTVAEREGEVQGYVLLFYRRGSSLARLYSIAMMPAFRGCGLGRALLAAAEDEATGHDCAYLRLEVRQDNRAAIALYERRGYKPFGVYADYYEDHSPAIRMEKAILPHLRPERLAAPYYPQSLEFTCGPAALMMAMAALNDEVELGQRLELMLWREATTIFMTSGHGGCSALGLALSAHRRGYHVTLYCDPDPSMFTDSVRSQEKKDVIRLVQEEMFQEVQEANIPFRDEPIGLDRLDDACNEGAIPVVLVSSYRLTGDKAPHWVTVVGCDPKHIYIHEPFVDPDQAHTAADCIGIPIPRADFARMTRYGRAQHHAALILRETNKNS